MNSPAQVLPDEQVKKNSLPLSLNGSGQIQDANTPVNILLVDDDARNLDVLENILQSPDYRLFPVQTAEAALMALIQRDFAAIILDIQMPGITGFELAKLIKQRKRSQLIPIIFLTAYFNEDRDVLSGYDVGAVEYLTKPVNPQILRSKINVFVELFRTSRALVVLNSSLQSEIFRREEAEEALLQANTDLEIRVQERTSSLLQANRHLSESEDRYRLILENALEYAVFNIDGKGCVVNWNAGARRALGYEEVEIVGRRLDITHTPEDRAHGLIWAFSRKGLERKSGPSCIYCERPVSVIPRFEFFLRCLATFQSPTALTERAV